MFLAAGACLATLTLAVGSAVADPSGPPVYRVLAGEGSYTTQDVMNALANAVTNNGTKILGSYDTPGSSPITTKNLSSCNNLPRRYGSTEVDELEDSQIGALGPGCFDFARTVYNDAPAHPGQNLTYIPFAQDGLSIITRASATVPKSLTMAQLQNLYNCVSPPPVGTFQPMLPGFGSGTRAYFLLQLGIPDTGDIGLANNRPCVRTTDINGNPLQDNIGNLLFASNQVEPYSVSSFIAQQSREVSDVHGNTVLGEINGIEPLMANPAIANGITSATRASTTLPKSLTIGQLQNLYNCVSPPVVGTFQPMLPASGSTLRANFLAELGIPNTPDIGTAGNRPCVRTTDVNGNPLAQDAGNLLFADNQLVPYDISAFINQQSRTTADLHGVTILDEIGGTLPLVQSDNTPMLHDVYNVLPNGNLDLDPVATTFVGATSQVCSNSAIIQQYGFMTNPACGTTTITTPNNPALTNTPITLDPLTAGNDVTITAHVPPEVPGWVWFIPNNCQCSPDPGGIIPVPVDINTGVASSPPMNLQSAQTVEAVFEPFNATMYRGSQTMERVP